jgi:hypothetical protein
LACLATLRIEGEVWIGNFSPEPRF